MNGRYGGPVIHCAEAIMDPRGKIITDNIEKPIGTQSGLDLEITALLLGWIVLEVTEVPLRHRYVHMSSDNTPTVAWSENMVVKICKELGRLLWTLALQQCTCQTSPLSTLHKAGILNVIAEIPSRPFVYKKVAF